MSKYLNDNELTIREEYKPLVRELADCLKSGTIAPLAKRTIYAQILREIADNLTEDNLAYWNSLAESQPLRDTPND